MAKQKMTAAEFIARYLEKRGVKHLYGVPGAAILPFYDAIKELTDIESYVVRHEQTGAFMADGYSRATGEVGVCAATSGPGGTNFLTGLYGAWMDSIPMIAIVGQQKNSLIGTMQFQEAPIVEMAIPVTKASYRLTDGSKAAAFMQEAWVTATTGRKGPVLLDLPVDQQKVEIEVDIDELIASTPVDNLPQATDADIEKTLELLKDAKRPVLLAGGGVNLSNSTEELKALAEELQIPVVTTGMGMDTFPNDHALFAGRMGTMLDTPFGNKTIVEADLVINLAGRFGDRSTGNVAVFTQNGKKIIHVNLDNKEIGKNVPTVLGIVSDVKTFMVKLAEAHKALGAPVAATAEAGTKLDLTEERTKWARKTDYTSLPIRQERALRELREFLDRDAFVSHDCGISQIWSCQLFETYVPRTYLLTGGAGTMGWGLGAAMAAKLAFPERQSVNILGDGSLGMSLQDIATAAKHDIPVIIFCMNNSLLGLIRQQQNWFYDNRRISTDLDYINELSEDQNARGIDFVKTAEGMGVRGERVLHFDDIKPALQRAVDSGKPYLIEVIVDGDPEKACEFSNNGALSGFKYSKDINFNN
ncbi:thiamine pyrophosphate-binding protein [Metabacillus fastidiosus]|uniref:Thiamine pyrophosphate-binding protein n=1 Tax=Metabacillus fastidiosus TaxID=1458 RepID=A0ABU6P2E9_9BACI|nr:thiamine pyrophosphate-binding protein [Metabacillus fastidiosus]MED4403537.1 thiamine pyrophosphate-binding protein [Metabacillus fastidiosus]MED4455673.1 thiamine pyrophosphate-binding protein [Metabacillus fastidiosus]MED4463737.1 thiamine pyrophosphate-binding protein [Metabacillus fastidiosus]